MTLRIRPLLVAAFEVLLEVLIGALADRFIRPQAGDLASEFSKGLALVLLKEIVRPRAPRAWQRLKRWCRSLRNR